MGKVKKEAYKAYLDRLSMPFAPKKLSQEEIEKYNRENPLPTEEELARIRKEAGL